MNWRPYWRIFVASAREDSANPKRIISSLVVAMFRVFLLSAIYAAAYRATNVNLPYQNAIWSLAAYFAFIYTFGIRDLFRVVEQDIQSGEVEVQLIKPVDWRLFKFAQVLGKNSSSFVIQVLIFPFYLLLLVGRPMVSFWSPGILIAFGFLTIFAMISGLFLNMCIGLAAFWLNDAKSVFRLFDKAILVFGGGLCAHSATAGISSSCCPLFTLWSLLGSYPAF